MLCQRVMELEAATLDPLVSTPTRVDPEMDPLARVQSDMEKLTAPAPTPIRARRKRKRSLTPVPDSVPGGDVDVIGVKMELKNPVMCDNLMTDLTKSKMLVVHPEIRTSIYANGVGSYVIECSKVARVSLDLCMQVFRIISGYGIITDAHVCCRGGVGVLLFYLETLPTNGSVSCGISKATRAQCQRLRVGRVWNTIGLAYQSKRYQSKDMSVDSGLMLLDDQSWYTYSRLPVETKAVLDQMIELDTAAKGCTSVCRISEQLYSDPCISSNGRCAGVGEVRVVTSWTVNEDTKTKNSAAWVFPLLDLSRLASGAGAIPDSHPRGGASTDVGLPVIDWSLEVHPMGVVVRACFWSKCSTLQSSSSHPVTPA